MNVKKLAASLMLSACSSATFAASWLDVVHNDLPDGDATVRFQRTYVSNWIWGRYPYPPLENCTQAIDTSLYPDWDAVVEPGSHAVGRKLYGAAISGMTAAYAPPVEELLICRAGERMPAYKTRIADLNRQIRGQWTGASVGKQPTDSLDCDQNTCYLFSTFDTGMHQTSHCYVAAGGFPYNYGFDARVVRASGGYDVRLDNFTVNGGHPGAAIELKDTTACPFPAPEQ